MDVLSKLVAYIFSEGATVIHAPVIFVTAAALVGWVIWTVTKNYYKGTCQALESQIRTLNVDVGHWKTQAEHWKGQAESGGKKGDLRIVPQEKKLEITQWVVTTTPSVDQRENYTYIQLIVKCLSNTRVTGCRGRLLRVYKKYVNQINRQATEMNEPFDLEWSNYPNTIQLTLEPGIDQRLNVCRSLKSVRYLQPTLLAFPARAHSVFDSTGTFKFDIKVTADDCIPVDVSITVTIDSCEWNRPIVELTEVHST